MRLGWEHQFVQPTKMENLLKNKWKRIHELMMLHLHLSQHEMEDSCDSIFYPIVKSWNGFLDKNKCMVGLDFVHL